MSELQKLPDLVVLVADESVHMRRIVREILLRSGIKRILEAADGADAIAQYTTLIPDVVILEWDLPILSGEDFIRLARTSPETAKRDTPIVLMLANPQKAVVSLAIKLGIKDIVAKPLSPKALCSRVFEAVVRAREAQRQRLKALRAAAPVPAGAKQAQAQPAAQVAAAG